jgi:hypothetical protein
LIAATNKSFQLEAGCLKSDWTMQPGIPLDVYYYQNRYNREHPDERNFVLIRGYADGTYSVIETFSDSSFLDQRVLLPDEYSFWAGPLDGAPSLEISAAGCFK